MCTKLNPAIFEEAAVRLLTGVSNCCCRAITRAVEGSRYCVLRDDEPHCHALLDLFAPDQRIERLEHQPAYYWQGGTEAERTEQRVLALLLLAEISKSPGPQVSTSSPAPRTAA